MYQKFVTTTTWQLQYRFTLISLEKALIPHLNVFCIFIMKTKKTYGKSEENKKLLNYNRWFVSTRVCFIVTKVVFVTMKQTSDNRMCYGFVKTNRGNMVYMLRVHCHESPFIVTKVVRPNNTYNLVQQIFENLYKEGYALGFGSSNFEGESPSQRFSPLYRFLRFSLWESRREED